MAAVEPMALGPVAVRATTSRSGQSAGLGQRVGDGVAAVGALARGHLDEAAEDRSRRRARAPAGQRRQLGGRQLQARRRGWRPAPAPRSPRPTRPARRRWAPCSRVDTSAGARRPARARTRSRKRDTRAANPASAGAPSTAPIVSTRSPRRRCRSPPSAQEAHPVSVPSSARVSDRLPVAGRFRAASRLPQYFTRAMLVPAARGRSAARSWNSPPPDRGRSRRPRCAPPAPGSRRRASAGARPGGARAPGRSPPRRRRRRSAWPRWPRPRARRGPAAPAPGSTAAARARIPWARSNSRPSAVDVPDRQRLQPGPAQLAQLVHQPAGAAAAAGTGAPPPRPDRRSGGAAPTAPGTA